MAMLYNERPTSGRAARLFRAALVVIAVALLTTCAEPPIAPRRTGRAFLSLAPVFPSSSHTAGLTLDNVQLVVVRLPNSTLLDKTYSFPADQTELLISEPIDLDAESELLQVTLTCLTGSTALFSRTAMVELRRGEGAGEPIPFPVVWVGPGNGIATILLAPRDTVLTFGASMAFQVTGTDGQGRAVTQFYVSWQSSDPGQRPNGAGVLRAGRTRMTLRITASTPNSEARDSTTVMIVPPATRLVPTAGDNQTAPVGTRLPQALEVEVRGDDDLPIPGVSVAFAAPIGGAVETPTAITDATGRARTGATLGPSEGRQNFTASAPGAGAVSFTAIATPLAVPTVSFTAPTQTVGEGVGTATITAQLSTAATLPVTVPYTVSGTATSPADYTITASPLVIAAGSLTGTITVTVVADGVAEPDETVIVTLGTPTNAALGATTAHTLTITGQVPTVGLTAATQAVGEGVGTATITAQLSSSSSQPVTVPFTVGGTATNPLDYTITASPLVIAAGSLTGTITVTVVADGIAEPDETVIVTLGTPTNAVLGATTVHTVTISGQVPTVSFTAAAQTVGEGVGAATITAQLSGASTQTVTVPYTIGGTAANPADYTISASPLVIVAGSTTGTITVNVVADGVAEPDETVIVTLGTPTNAALGATTSHTLTITGQVPTVSLTAAVQAVSEGAGTATITAQLSGTSTQAVTVPYTVAGTATNPADYTITASPLVITAGNTTATITVNLVADGVAEPDETVIVTLGSPTNATLGATTVHTLTILGQIPTVSFTAASQAVGEGVGTATITAQLSSTSSQVVTVPFTVGGTATNPADYTITASPLVIAAGSTTATITVTVVADGVAEPDETVIVTLGTPTNAVLGATTSHTLTITGQVPTVNLTAAVQAVSEGAGTATITAQLSGTSTQAVTVPYTVSGTATNPADYTITASPLVIAAGSTTATITVTIVADGVAEPDETVIVTLGTPTNAALGVTTVHTLTINAQVPTVSFTAAAQNVNEGVVATITAQLSSTSTQAVTVPYTLSGTANNPADFTITASPLVIAAGSTIATITVTVVADAVAEPNETVVVTMGTPTNAALGATTAHTLTINSQTPTVSFSTAAQTVVEGATATITAQLSTPSAQTVTVPYTVSGSASNPADYTITAGPLVIAAGNTTGTITVTVATDTVAEPNETVVVTMGTPTNATAVSPTVHTLTIAAQLPSVFITAASNTVSENVGTATISLRLSSVSTQTVSVPFTLSGTASSPADYGLNETSPIVFPAGFTTASIDVRVVDDATPEPDETVVVSLGTPTGATLGSPSVHTLTIRDNDEGLTVTLSGRGSGTVATPAGFSPAIDCSTGGPPAQCSATYLSGTQVSLTATPLVTSEGIFRFEGWSGTGTGFTCTTNPTCVVVMDQVRQVTARFSTWGTITFVPPSAGFAMLERGTPPAATTVSVRNSGERPLLLNSTIPITYAPQVTPWLDARLDRLTIDTLTPGTLTLTVLSTASGLAAGTYQASVILRDDGLQRSWTLPVTLTITGAHPPVLSNISYTQPAPVNSCNIFGGPLGTEFLVRYDYTDAGGDVRTGATIFVNYLFSNGGVGSFDEGPFSSIGGNGLTGTIQSDVCFIFGSAATFVDVTITVTDLAGFTGQPIVVRILRPAGANKGVDPRPLGLGSASPALLRAPR